MRFAARAGCCAACVAVNRAWCTGHKVHLLAAQVRFGAAQPCCVSVSWCRPALVPPCTGAPVPTPVTTAYTRIVAQSCEPVSLHLAADCPMTAPCVTHAHAAARRLVRVPGPERLLPEGVQPGLLLSCSWPEQMTLASSSGRHKAGPGCSWQVLAQCSAPRTLVCSCPTCHHHTAALQAPTRLQGSLAALLLFTPQHALVVQTARLCPGAGNSSDGCLR